MTGRRWILTLVPLGAFLLVSTLQPHAEAGPKKASAGELDSLQQLYLSERSSCADAMLTGTVKDAGIAFEQVAREATAMSEADEAALGDQLAASVDQAYAGSLVRTGPFIDYVQAIVDSLTPFVERPDIRYRIAVIVDPSVNAFAMPGGYLYLHTGLLEAATRNEAQLATVIAHEIRHVDLRHCVAAIQYLLATGMIEAGDVGQMMVQMARHPYSSRLEEEADARGVELVAAAGYSPLQSVSLWENWPGGDAAAAAPTIDPINDPLGALLGTLTGELDALLQTHPPASRRACLLQQEAHDLFQAGKIIRPYIGRENYRVGVPASKKLF